MAAESTTNAIERQRWNSDYWASVWPKRQRLTNVVTDILLDQVALVQGQRVIDIGSGGGTASAAAARRVGARGAVVGADISVPLVDFARRRARDQGLVNVSFVVADAQHDTIPGAPFDAAISQFGVMFFDEPVTAFRNIRRHLVPAARISFACWQSVEQNPWWTGPALADLVPAPPLAPGKSPTGPFSFSQPDRVSEILTASGFNEISRSAYEVVVNVDRETIIDEEWLAFQGIPEPSFDDARRRIDEHLEPLTRGDGRIDAPLAFQVFTAVA